MVMGYSRRSKFECTSEGLARLLKIGRRESQCKSRESIAGEVKICQMFRPDLPCLVSRTCYRRSPYKGLPMDWSFRTEASVGSTTMLFTFAVLNPALMLAHVNSYVSRS